MPYRLCGKFGMVWDETKSDTCDGRWEKYNNPYKLLLYICAGMPMVVWDKSTIADFVNEENIGIALEGKNNKRRDA